MGELLDVIDTLRQKCPWDSAQTPESLRPNTIEEVMELSEAIVAGDGQNVRKELGDVLLHVLMLAKMGDEKGQYDIADVCNSLREKLIFRHPHIYGQASARTAQEVSDNWELIKLKEKNGNKTVLGGVPNSLPPLIKAYRMQDKARAVGFDWEKREDVWNKVAEELGEFKEALGSMEDSQAGRDAAQGELGDLLFSIVNASRLYKLNPDTALETTCNKFRSRFTYVEMQARQSGRDIKDLTLAEMDAFWEEAKKSE